MNLEVEDLRTNSLDSVDYPDYGAAVGRFVANGKTDKGILVCGSGIGSTIAANKFCKKLNIEKFPKFFEKIVSSLKATFTQSNRTFGKLTRLKIG